MSMVKNKEMNVLILFIIILFFPFQVFASTDVDFSCPVEAMAGNQIECSIQLKNLSQKVMGIQVYYEIPQGLSYIGTDIGNDWEDMTSNNNGFIVANLDGVTKESLVAKVHFMVSDKVEVGKDYTIYLKNIELSDGESDIAVSDKNVSIKILSIYDLLDELTLNGTSLELKDGVNNYTFTLEDETDEVELGASLKKEGFIFADGYGSRVIRDLKVGENIEYLKIISGDREIITYTFHIYNLTRCAS